MRHRSPRSGAIAMRYRRVFPRHATFCSTRINGHGTLRDGARLVRVGASLRNHSGEHRPRNSKPRQWRGPMSGRAEDKWVDVAVAIFLELRPLVKRKPRFR